MASKDDFYIGYLPHVPQPIAKLIRFSVGIMIIGVIIFALVLATNQWNLQANDFEFGKTTELTGVLQATPVPNLIIDNGQDIHGNPLYQSVLLIGLGKFGADSLVQHFENQIKTPLNQTQVTLKGTLIYSDGKTLLELTDEENAFVSSSSLDSAISLPPIQKIGKTELKGEMVDSKCYFGVMNPGHGKPHLSCAVRCVSGGIPPVFWTKKADGSTDYYLVLGKNGEAVQQEVLPYIAEPACITGEIMMYLDWKIIYTDTDNIKPMGCSGL